MKYIITEQCATGQVYTRPPKRGELVRRFGFGLGGFARWLSTFSGKPGTREAVGCWSYALAVRS